jgi:phosphate transport system protein
MSQHLQSAIKNIENNLLTLMEYTESTVEMAVRAASNRDEAMAKDVLSSDDEIDQMEVEIEEECLKIMALNQPVAKDLRFLITVLKVNNDLERIGDLAVNISERALTIIGREKIDAPFDFQAMADKTKKMLKLAIDSLIKRDVDMAKEVCQSDEVVDAMNKEMYQQVHKAIIANPEQVDFYLQYLSISRHLERIADYTTNIAEDVIYMVDGEIVRHSPTLYE